jgi:hypothetical protein
MFRLMPESKGYLFASRELRQVTEGIRAEIRREIDSLEPNRLLNTAPAGFQRLSPADFADCAHRGWDVGGAVRERGFES